MHGDSLHWKYGGILFWTDFWFKAKEKYRGVFEIQKSGDKTSSGEIGLDIRTHASPKVGQNVANIQSVNAFIGEFDIQKRAVPCFCRFTDIDSFEKPVWRNIQNNTLKSMSGRSNVSKMQGQGGLVQGM